MSPALGLLPSRPGKGLGDSGATPANWKELGVDQAQSQELDLCRGMGSRQLLTLRAGLPASSPGVRLPGGDSSAPDNRQFVRLFCPKSSPAALSLAVSFGSGNFTSHPNLQFAVNFRTSGFYLAYLELPCPAS